MHPVQFHILGRSLVIVPIFLDEGLEVDRIIDAQLGRPLLSRWPSKQSFQILHRHALSLYLSLTLLEVFLFLFHDVIDEAIDIDQIGIDMRVGGLPFDDALLVAGLDALRDIFALLSHQQ